MFGVLSVDFVKGVNITLESTMKVYERLIVTCYRKLDHISQCSS